MHKSRIMEYYRFAEISTAVGMTLQSVVLPTGLLPSNCAPQHFAGPADSTMQVI